MMQSEPQYQEPDRAPMLGAPKEKAHHQAGF
jgi:hypothetical protein